MILVLDMQFIFLSAANFGSLSRGWAAFVSFALAGSRYAVLVLPGIAGCQSSTLSFLRTFLTDEDRLRRFILGEKRYCWSAGSLLTFSAFWGNEGNKEVED